MKEDVKKDIKVSTEEEDDAIKEFEDLEADSAAMRVRLRRPRPCACVHAVEQSCPPFT